MQLLSCLGTIFFHRIKHASCERISVMVKTTVVDRRLRMFVLRNRFILVHPCFRYGVLRFRSHPSLSSGVWCTTCGDDFHARVLQDIYRPLQACSVLRNGHSLFRVLRFFQDGYVPHAGCPASLVRRRGDREVARGDVISRELIPALDVRPVLRGGRAILFGERRGRAG